MSGGRAPKRKGYEGEREFAALIGGKRVPLSGALPDMPGDVIGLGLTWQVKRRRDAFRQLYAWLEKADALALRADNKGWLIVLPLETFRARKDTLT